MRIEQQVLCDIGGRLKMRVKLSCLSGGQSLLTAESTRLNSCKTCVGLLIIKSGLIWKLLPLAYFAKNNKLWQADKRRGQTTKVGTVVISF